MSSVSNVVNSGLGMVTGGLAGPIADRAGSAIWGGGGGGGMAPSQYSQAPIQQRSMGQAQMSPYIQQYLAARKAGIPMPQQLPAGQTVQPLAWRPQAQRPQIPYQNTGMFGQYNPFMPRR